MNLLIPILILAAVAATIIFIVNPSIRRRDAKQAQKRVDQNIEKMLLYQFEIDIEFLGKHSDIEFVAGVVSTRLKNFIEHGIAPVSLYEILKKLCIVSPVIGARTPEERLRSLIQGNMLRDMDSYNMELYMIAGSKSKKEDWHLLNKTFLTRVEKNMLIWSPLDKN
jgi:hypothetical protein